MSDISKAPVKNFLDAVDIVLNSNTFLLSYTPSKPGDIAIQLTNYLNSEDFKEQITKQDVERAWYNMYFFDNESYTYKLKPGNLVKPDFALKISTPAVEKKEYLVAMITADTKVSNFFSPYFTQKGRADSVEIVDNFINCLFPHDTWRLFNVHPDFLYSALEVSDTSENIQYFEGSYGCDTATLLVSEKEHYLLLTNGIP